MELDFDLKCKKLRNREKNKNIEPKQEKQIVLLSIKKRKKQKKEIEETTEIGQEDEFACEATNDSKPFVVGKEYSQRFQELSGNRPNFVERQFRKTDFENDFMLD